MVPFKRKVLKYGTPQPRLRDIGASAACGFEHDCCSPDSALLVWFEMA